jgi:hypothetical protein
LHVDPRIYKAQGISHDSARFLALISCFADQMLWIAKDGYFKGLYAMLDEFVD